MTKRKTTAANHTKPGNKFLPKELKIIYEDRDILVVDKPQGLLTMATDKEKTRTAYYALTDYVKKGYSKSKNRIFIVHRLDKDTSGILIFAKNEKAKYELQSNWGETKKKYIAAVHGRLKKQTDTITTYLTENKTRIVYSTRDEKKGKLAKTAYNVIKETKFFSLLEIDLLTGRKHQIRVHLKEIGNPVVGDKKYGKDKSYKRMALHAASISFKHPFTHKNIAFEAKTPKYFNELIGCINSKENNKKNIA